MSKKKLKPIRSFKKLAQKQNWAFQVQDNTFCSLMGFREFPGISARVQITWDQDTFLCAYLILSYEPKLTDLYDFKELINQLNDKHWGITIVWKESVCEIRTKFLELPDRFTIRDAEEFLKHMNGYGAIILDRIYPRGEREQAEWIKDSEEKLLLQESAPAGYA